MFSSSSKFSLSWIIFTNKINEQVFIECTVISFKWVNIKVQRHYYWEGEKQFTIIPHDFLDIKNTFHQTTMLIPRWDPYDMHMMGMRNWKSKVDVVCVYSSLSCMRTYEYTNTERLCSNCFLEDKWTWECACNFWKVYLFCECALDFYRILASYWVVLGLEKLWRKIFLRLLENLLLKKNVTEVLKNVKSKLRCLPYLISSLFLHRAFSSTYKNDFNVRTQNYPIEILSWTLPQVIKINVKILNLNLFNSFL